MKAYTRNELAFYGRQDLAHDLAAANGKILGINPTLGMAQISVKGVQELEQKYPQLQDFLLTKGYSDRSLGLNRTMEETECKSRRGSIPILTAALIVVVFTAGSFWLFGGGHYLAHKADMDYGHFHHEEDLLSPLNWFLFSLETGQLAGIGGLVLSVSFLPLLHRRHK